MSVRLLLLLALVGPFCAFTRAVPTELPGDLTTVLSQDEVSAATATAEADTVTATSLPPSTEPATTQAEVTSEALTEPTTAPLTETNTPDVTTVGAEVLTSGPITPTAETEGLMLVETVQTSVAEAPEVGVREDVLVEDNTAEGLGSGQVAGIVIGALLAVVVVVAVVIVVVRRMGKYSP